MTGCLSFFGDFHFDAYPKYYIFFAELVAKLLVGPGCGLAIWFKFVALIVEFFSRLESCTRSSPASLHPFGFFGNSCADADIFVRGVSFQ